MMFRVAGRVPFRLPSLLPASLLLAWLLMILPRVGAAQALLDPYASVDVDHDTNVFRVQNSTVSDLLYGTRNPGDTDEKYTVGMSGTYQWSLQKFSETLEVRRFDYDRFTDLDRYEYLANLELDWRLSRLIDGVLQYHDERVAASFANNDSFNLEIDTDRNATAKVNFELSPDWRLETGANDHVLHAPLQNYSGFVEHETGTHLGLTYLGFANLTYGLAVDHISGDYQDAPDVGPYSQTAAVLKLHYLISGLTNLNGAVGYTRRDQTGVPNLSEMTGDISYTRQLTGKTALVLDLARGVNGYLASGGLEVDTTGTVALTWKATYKLTVDARAGYTHSAFLGSVIPGTTTEGRLDHSPVAQLNIIYMALRQLEIKAFVVSQYRASTDQVYDYNDTTYGIQALAHWR